MKVGNENEPKYLFNGIRLSCYALDKNAINYGGNLLIVSDAAAANKFLHEAENFSLLFLYFSRIHLTSHNGGSGINATAEM